MDMSYAANVDFIRALARSPMDRVEDDLHIIYAALRRLDIFHRLGDGPLRAVCRSARYERHAANEILYSFGKRSGNSNRRPNDCLVLEQSEMIVIDYPDVQHNGPHGPVETAQRNSRKAIQSMNLDHVVLSASGVNNGAAGGGHHPAFSRPPAHLTHSASTSTAYHRQNHSTSNTHLDSNSSSSSTVSANSGSAATTPTSSLMRHRQYRTQAEGNPGDRGSRGSKGAEQMREVETMFHRSEVYLAGGHQEGGGRGMASPSGSGGFQRAEGSTRSSTSSAYSGSTDQMTPSTSVAEDELAGLPEANVDSDEDDDESCPSGDSFVELRDNVRDCLEKGPEERTEDDLLVLLDFMQHMPAFADLPMSVKRELCWRMVFAVVDKAGSSVMQDGEQLDSWCVIVNGEVEVILPDGGRLEYHLGDSFGVEPRPEPQFNLGQMRTMVDDCQFVLVTQEDYVAIISKVADNLQKQMDAAGEIVSETEKRTIDHQEAYVIIKAKPGKLIDSLVEESTGVDPYFVEDFLLMYRTFINDPVTIFEKLTLWFAETSLREKVARLVLLWVNNHFNDFETNPQMMSRLESFEQALERENMHNHTSLLNIACSVKSKSRTVTYTRSNKDEILHFSVLGGHEKGYGIFVAKVASESKAEKVGLKRGDEILEVNGQNFQHVQHQRALDILRGATHLSITVKSNLLGFKEMLAAPDRSDSSAASSNPERNKSLKKAETQIRLNPPPLQGIYQPHLPRANHSAVFDSKMGVPPYPPVSPGGRYDSKTGKLSKLINRLKMTSVGSIGFEEHDYSDGAVVSLDPDPRKGVPKLISTNLKPSRSNPDITEHSIHGIPGGMNQYYQPLKSTCPEHVLKIYRSDQSFKYLTVYKETSAKNVVQLALQEFGMAETTSSEHWMLSEGSVTPEGIIKSRCLPDQMMNLAERISLNSRYYLKNKNKSEIMIPDDLAPEVMKAAEIQFLQLNAAVIAAQLTLQDFAVFASIEPTEYIDNLFKRMSAYGWPKLEDFEDLVNQEMWWVATEICSERSVIRRSKLVKKFIKIARYCRDCKNFNSMFAIMSALEKPAVRRLHHTWDKVAGKYMKMFEDLQLLLDPSRNMSKYRQHLVNMSENPPVVPLYPVIKKDLTFIHEGNPTWRDGMVNFEKLRMIAKEVRAVSKLGSAPYDLSSMFEGAGKLNDALIHMNTFMDGVSGNSVATMRKHNLQKTNHLPRKKLYENAQMIRKVKSYLSNLKIISAESELDKLSTECEPQVGSGSMGKDLNVMRKRLPSPSPSSSSSLSNASDPYRRFQARFDHIKPHEPGPRQIKLSAEAGRTQRGGASSRVPATLPPGIPGPMISGSPNPSPCPPRRSNRANRIPSSSSSNGGHGRSQSESVGSSVLPVDLTAENSSVTTFLTPGGRISSTGSVTSTDSAVSQQSVPSSLSISHAISCDSTDSGHASMDAHSNGASPPNQRRSYPPNPSEGAGAGGRPRNPPPTGAHMGHHRPSPAYFQQGGRLMGKTKAPPPPAASAAYVAAHHSGQFHVRRTNSVPGNNPADKNNPGNEQVSRV